MDHDRPQEEGGVVKGMAGIRFVCMWFAREATLWFHANDVPIVYVVACRWDTSDVKDEEITS